MERNILFAKNPWWKGKEHFEEDEDYRKWKEKKIKWLPKALEQIKIKPFSLHFILGPRQAGKTTLLKLKIRELLESGKYKPEQIFYFRCEELRDYKEIDELLESYSRLRGELQISSSVIFLDEITFADEWFRSIKSRIDEGKFKEDVLIITGSASFEVMKHAEYFPGRRGHGEDFLILPLSFREFIEVMEPEICQKIPALLSLGDIEIKAKAAKAFLNFDELNKLLSLYLKIGGFPLAINSYAEYKRVDSSVNAAYLSWIKNDIVKAGRSINIAREILKSVMSKIPSPISWENISRETSIKSPKTINAYLHMLQEMFLIRISYFLDLNNLTTEFGKNKKIHIIDPLLYEIFEEWCLVELKDKENKKVEDLLASHLFRFAKNSKIFSEEIFYWQNSIEVDSIIRAKDRAVGFEAKWSNRVKPARMIIGKMKDVYLISKNTFEPSQRIIPLSVFLALLDFKIG
ncbi:ATP-binding protein [Candidatus Pacearchaeota archaeon]|nr:ATP-binding protein [Candidatus Pacearchaeota archaeon]